MIAQPLEANAKTTSPRQRFYALPSGKRAQLLDPAEAEFAAKGFNGASLNRILTQAGMSKGQAYYYFQNKAELYCLVCERAFEKLSAKLGGWQINDETADSFWNSVADLFANVSSIFMTDLRLAEIGRSIYASENAYAALSEPLKQVQSFMQETVQRGQAIDAIRSDMPNDLLSSLLFAHLSALDRWFAANIEKLDPSELLRLSTLNLQIFKTIAAPASHDRKPND